MFRAIGRTSAVTVVRQCIQDLATSKNVETHKEDIIEDKHDGSGFTGKAVATGELESDVDDVANVCTDVGQVSKIL